MRVASPLVRRDPPRIGYGSTMRAMLTVLWLAVLGCPLAAAAAPGRPGGTGFAEYERRLKAIYQQGHPCPVNGKRVGNCPGYEVGYRKHPRNGGAVSQDNMRWMTSEEYERTDQKHAPG